MVVFVVHGEILPFPLSVASWLFTLGDQKVALSAPSAVSKAMTAEARVFTSAAWASQAPGVDDGQLAVQSPGVGVPPGHVMLCSECGTRALFK